MSKTRSLKMKGLSLLVAVVMAMAALPLVATPALADEPCPDHKVWVYPATQTVAPGDTFTVKLMQDSPAGTRGTQVGEFGFDHTVVEIVSVAAGAAYQPPAMMMPAPAGMADAIAEANADGSLDAPVAAFFLPGMGSVPAGEAEFLVIEMKALPGIVGTHTVALTLDELSMLRVGEPPVFPTGTDGEVVVEGPPAPMPDLVVTDVSTEWVKVGETYTVTFTITNQGDLGAPVSTTSILIDGTEVATEACSALDAGASETKTVGPFTLTDEEDTIEVVADKGDVVTEGNEGNNSKETILAAVRPDLVVTAVSTEWVDVGKTYTVTFTIKNEGDAEAAASTASIVIDGTEAATADVPVLGVGETHEVTTEAFTLIGDSDTIRVVADKDDVVTEGDEGNNSRETIRDALPPQPDLIVSEVDVEWVVVGESYFVEFTIENKGGATADPSIASIVIDGIEVERVELGRLRADRDSDRTVGPFYYTLPGDTITVIADKCNLVAEADEDNNSVTITRGKVPPPVDEVEVEEADLVVTDVSTKWEVGKEGESYFVEFTIENKGGAPAGPSIASITIDGVEVATAVVPVELAARATHKVTTEEAFTLTGPSDTVKVSADRNDDVVEASEINNCSLEVKVHALRFWGDATTHIIAEVPVAYAAISVPASLEIPAERGQLNTVAVPVEIDSNTRWQLQVRDAAGRGHMIRGDDQLEQPMKVVNANNTVCLTEGGVLHEGERSETVNSHLQQRVEFTDAAGKYTITLTFTVYPVW
ncbi:hypothetical protein M1O19_02285 [Dehalococcoidia bacterium]|nr:hypothetical protein [Dehalococcoidia bacterium]